MDQGEGALGVEFRLEHQQLAVQHGLHRVAARRAVVERCGEERAHAGLDAMDTRHALAVQRIQGGDFLGPGREAAHALGAAGGAGGVGHRHARTGRRAGPRRLRAQPFVPVVDGGNGRGFDLLAELERGDQHLGAAVLQDPAGFLGLIVPVDRAAVGAEQPRAEHRGEVRRFVVQHDANHVAFADAQLLEAARGATCGLLELRRRDLAAAKAQCGAHAGSCL
jgi:hypothetical protein